MRRSLLAVALSLVSCLALGTPAAATKPGGWNHLGNGGSSSTPALNGRVLALNADNAGVLYVGGQFDNAGGVAKANRIAKWDGASWSAVGTTQLTTTPSKDVRAIAYHAGKVYVGGTFLNGGGNADADFLAVWNGTSWGTACNGNPLTATVSALQVIGNTLYIGGSFADGAGVTTADYLLACDLTTGAPSATVDGENDIGGAVDALTADSNGVLYAGGSFINMAGIPGADHVAYYDGTWHGMGSQHAVGGGVYSLAANGTDVYVGAGDQGVNIGGIARADHVARWDGAWHALGSNTAGNGGWFDSFAFPYGMTTSGSLLFVTGSFQNANGEPTADDIAYFDGTTWHPLGSNGAGNGPLTQNGLALAIFKHNVVVGGSFQAGSDPIANNIASYALLRPDMRIGVNVGGPWVGNNVYSPTGAGESKTISVARGHSGVFYLEIQNDGLQGGLWWIQGPAGSNGFTVTYFDGATNVTSQVEGGGRPISLAPGAHKALEMVVHLSASSGSSTRS